MRAVLLFGAMALASCGSGGAPAGDAEVHLFDAPRLVCASTAVHTCIDGVCERGADAIGVSLYTEPAPGAIELDLNADGAADVADLIVAQTPEAALSGEPGVVHFAAGATLMSVGAEFADEANRFALTTHALRTVFVVEGTCAPAPESPEWTRP